MNTLKENLADKKAQEIFGGDAEAVKQMIFDEMKSAKVKVKGRDWELTGTNFKTLLKEKAEDGWTYEEKGKKLNLKSEGMAWDGANVKTKAARVVGQIKEREVKYEDALGTGIDIKLVQGNYKLQKIITIESLASLGEIPVGAEFLEFSFRVSGDFDLPEGKIDDRIPFGENSFVNPVRAWDSSETPEFPEDEIQSGAFGEISGKVITKKIPVAWLQQATFPVMTDTTITFGSVAVFESASTYYISATYDSTNNKIVIAYRDDGNTCGTAVVGTVSGTSISFGTPAVFESASIYDTSATYDSTNNKIVIAYRDGGNSNFGTAVVGTVSGTSISFGTPAIFNSVSTYYISATYDSTNSKVVIAYYDGGNSGFGTAVVGTVSGTSISFGTPAVFESASIYDTSATYDSTNNKIVIAYRDDGNSNFGTAVVGTVSGTSISFGTPAIFNSVSTLYTSATYDSTNSKVVIAYRDAGNSGFGTAVVGTTEEAAADTGNFFHFFQ